MAGGRSDIYRVTDVAGQPGPELALLASSFGWNASLPPQSPFSDLEPWRPLLSGGRLPVGQPGDRRVRRRHLPALLPPSGEPSSRRCSTGLWGSRSTTGCPLAPFLDLGEDVASLYPREYVSAAYYQGLVQGYPQGLFRPWDKVSRMQAVTMLVRAARIYLHQGLAAVPEGWTGATSSFSDPDHGHNLQLAEYNGLLAGIDLSGWDVTAPATRGEAAQLLVNLMRLRGPVFASDILLGVSGPPAGSSTGAAPRRVRQGSHREHRLRWGLADRRVDRHRPLSQPADAPIPSRCAVGEPRHRRAEAPRHARACSGERRPVV